MSLWYSLLSINLSSILICNLVPSFMDVKFKNIIQYVNFIKQKINITSLLEDYIIFGTHKLYSKIYLHWFHIKHLKFSQYIFF